MNASVPPSTVIPTLVVRPTGPGGLGDADREPSQRPLDLALIRRVFGYTRPYRRQLGWLLFAVLMRAVQLPAGAWMIGRIIQGPITRGDLHGTLVGAALFGVLAVWTAANFHFRIRLVLELGEAVIHDLRADMFAHLQRMTIGFYHRTKLGRIISRMTSDIDAVRQGVQDVLFVTLVQIGQMLFAGLVMLYTDPVLFCAVLAIAPIIWAINRHFRARLSTAYREQQESFSRITATLAESVNGIRVTQGFVRQEVNAGMFRDLMADHFQIAFGAARLAAMFLPLLELNSQFFISILLLLGGYRALNPAVATPVGDLIQFSFWRDCSSSRCRSSACSIIRRSRRWRGPSGCSSCSTARPTGRMNRTRGPWRRARQACGIPRRGICLRSGQAGVERGRVHGRTPARPSPLSDIPAAAKAPSSIW